MKNILIALTLAIAAQNAHCETYLTVTVGSYHFDRDAKKRYDYNEKNIGLGMHLIDGVHGFTFGSYINSIRKTSCYALGSYAPLRTNDDSFAFGIVYGAVTGYNIAPVVPAIGLYSAFRYKKIGLNLIAVPTFNSMKYDGFVGAALSFKIN